MALVNVIKFELMVDNQPVDTVSNMLFLKLRLEYEGGPSGIFPGDQILVEIDNIHNATFDIIGLGNNTINIFGDGNIGRVGIRTYQNTTDGYILEVTFDDGYETYFGGHMPGNITGWIESSAYVSYTTWVTEPFVTNLNLSINGVDSSIPVNVFPGGGPGPDRLPTPGPIIGKAGRYGTHSGNLYDLPEVSENDYQNFEVMRWSLNIGYQNLTWRELRATEGEDYFTSEESLTFSNLNRTESRYQSDLEPYLEPYALQQGYPIDTPYLYKNCYIEDYLVIGDFNGVKTSDHAYIKDSIRIVRVMGRQKNTDWWGSDAFLALADSNFLKYDPSQPIDRFLTDLYFKGYRGLTLDEFLSQMHTEGQLLDKTSVDDILEFKYVRNSEAPGTNPTDTRLIPYFKLVLGDLFFTTSNPINLIAYDNSVVFSGVDSENLPYAYLVYYDTEATAAELSKDGFYYNNAARFHFYDDTRYTISNNLWIKLEDGSGGSGQTSDLRIKKVDEFYNSIEGVLFELISNGISRKAYTTVNGEVSFTLRLGTYTLIDRIGEPFVPIEPITFVESTAGEDFNLRRYLESTGYPDIALLDFIDGINIITNLSEDSPCDRRKAINKIISSIAVEELALANVIFAEGYKVKVTAKLGAGIKDMIRINKSITKTLSTILNLQFLLNQKLTKALSSKECK